MPRRTTAAARSVDSVAVLRSVGLRATPQRLAVLSALQQAAGAHLSADEAWQRLDGTPRIDRSTAYRILADLTAAGLLKQVRLGDGVSRFEIQSTEHHHAVCAQCRSTLDIEASMVQSWGEQLRDATGFLMGGDALLLTGVCGACTARAARAQEGGPPRG